MTIRLIRTATIARYERSIEALKRDLAHVSIHRDLIQQRLDAAETTGRDKDRAIKVITEENSRLIELMNELFALLRADGLDDEPAKMTIQ